MAEKKYPMYDQANARAMLVCISNNLNLIQSDRWPVDKSYFRGKIDQLWYILLKRLYSAGKLKAEVPDLVAEAESNDNWMNIIEEEELVEFWSIQLEDINNSALNYEGYYNICNLWTLLRALKSNGFNIDRFYDEDTDELRVERSVTAKHVIEEISSELSNLRTCYDNKFCRQEIIAGQNTDELIEMFEQTPALGLPFPSSAMTELTNGLLPGTLHCISATSGSGKTIYAVSTICKTRVSEYWSFEIGCFVPNPYYDPELGHTLMIHTEMDSYTELNVRFLACISGVNGKKIRTGMLNESEKKRVRHAGKVIQESGIHLVAMPDYTPSTIREKCIEIHHKYGLALLVHDYVEINSALSGYYKDNKEIQRPDQIILSVMTELKSLAEEMQIAILTFTQTNTMEKEMEFPDAGCIAGAKSVQNKLDSGCIMMPTSLKLKDKNKAMNLYKNNIVTGNFSEEESFDIVMYCYKARSGEYGGYKLKIFCGLDYGTCRQRDWIIMTNTDQVFNKFDIDKWYLEGWYPDKNTPERYK